ncbi:MAG: hypothetical protein Q8936_12105 [Bacillota bacterium]|nr:hypothetical protein [Bacillota bacterium]
MSRRNEDGSGWNQSNRGTSNTANQSEGFEQAKDAKKELDMTNERRVKELENLVEKHTRTQRHIEQHADISDEDNLAHANRIQSAREEEINNLEDAIVYGTEANNDQLQNLRENFERSHNYLENNADHMHKDQINAIEEKQRHRKEQLSNLE